jgi:hypothetical protein
LQQPRQVSGPLRVCHDRIPSLPQV